MDMHVARGWFGHEMEDGCPCEKATCGFVVLGEFSSDCTIHTFTKTIRQGHSEEFCPGSDEW